MEPPAGARVASRGPARAAGPPRGGTGRRQTLRSRSTGILTIKVMNGSRVREADRVNAERATTINGRCYAHAAAWAYIDAMVSRDSYSAGAIQPDARIYTQFDANYNVTALIGYNASANAWGVAQRYVYTPYGVATVLDAVTSSTFSPAYAH